MTVTIDISSIDEPVITISRMFDAPRALVWRALIDPKQVAMWYGAPGFTNPVCEMDVRPGGTWHHVMQAPDGTRITINSVFTEVEEPARLAWRTLKDPNQNPAPPTSLNTVTLEAHDTRTQWTVVSRFDSIADRDMSAKIGFEQMVAASAERLAKHLETL